MRLSAQLLGLLLFPVLHVTAQSGSESYGASYGDKICKQVYTDFITCALSVDMGIDAADQSMSFQNPSECDAYYASDLQTCYGAFWALYSAGDIGSGSPPAVIAGGIKKTGSLYAYYSLPSYDTYNAKGVYPTRDLDCKVCGQFFKRNLQCALPFDPDQTDLTSALLECAGITKDDNDEFVFTDANDYILATMCGLLNGQYSAAPSEADASDQVSYALVTPIVSTEVSQQCPAVEAHAKKFGGVSVKTLKTNVIFP